MKTTAAPQSPLMEPLPVDDDAVSKRRPPRSIIGGLLVAIAVATTISVFLAKAPSRPPPLVAPRPAMQVGDGFVKVRPETPTWHYLAFATAEVGPALAPLPAPGRIVFDESRSAAVVASLPGRIEKVGIELGQVVRRGEPLIAIRSTTVPDLRRDVDLASGSVRAKRTILERAQALAEVRAVSQKDLLNAQHELREAELALAAVLDKKKALQIASFGASGLYWIRAGQDGTVVERRALIGMEVGPEREEPLAVVARLDEIIAIADVVEAEAARITEGHSAKIALSSQPTELFEGRIEHVARIVDPLRRTVAVRVRVKNSDGRLRPNAFARVTFSPGQQPLVIVPTDAVVTDDSHSVVFVRRPIESGAFRLDRRAVVVGRSQEGRTEILSGLAAGETFVSRGALLILNAIDLAD